MGAHKTMAFGRQVRSSARARAASCCCCRCRPWPARSFRFPFSNFTHSLRPNVRAPNSSLSLSLPLVATFPLGTTVCSLYQSTLSRTRPIGQLTASGASTFALSFAPAFIATSRHSLDPDFHCAKCAGPFECVCQTLVGPRSHFSSSIATSLRRRRELAQRLASKDKGFQSMNLTKWTPSVPINPRARSHSRAPFAL